MVRALARRGVPAEATTQTVLVMLASYYSAYLIVAFAALGVLWRYHRANIALVAAAALLAAFAIAVPMLVLSLRRWSKGAPPAWLCRLPGFAASFERIATAPIGVLRDKWLLAESLLLQLGVFMLDAATLWVAFRALGAPIGFPVAFVSFVLASVVATIGLVPLGLGTFEAAAVGLLHAFGVGVETAFAATLVLRGLTFWLPMLPGVWLARREVGGSLHSTRRRST